MRYIGAIPERHGTLHYCGDPRVILMDSVGTRVKSPPDSAHADDAGDAQTLALMTAAQQVDRCKVLTLIGHPHPTMPPIGRQRTVADADRAARHIGR